MSATKPYIVEDGEFVDLEKKPGETPEDAYAEYISRRREADEVEKICTLKLPEKQMKAVALVISDALAEHKAELPAEHAREWESVLKEMMKAVREAE